VIRGYACVFDTWSRPLTEDGDIFFRERINVGAFRLAGAAIQATVNHHERTSFASTVNGSLRFWQDSYGLAFSADLPADSRGDGARYFAGSGRRCSVGLIVRGDTWEHDGELPSRTIYSARIDHVTLCSGDDVAYPETGAWLASEESALAPHYRALAQRWRHEGNSSGPTASARGYVRLSEAEMRARGRFIIPDSILKMAARAAHYGRCA
jgi:phage head maturation protease